MKEIVKAVVIAVVAAMILTLGLTSCVQDHDHPPSPQCETELREQRDLLDDQCLALIVLMTEDCSEWDLSRPGGWDP